LINVARSQIVDRDHFLWPWLIKKIEGAAFDVFWEEPADPNDGLLKLDNFVFDPTYSRVES
jgi:D-3-phosphoglycerate dehydrogenase / 2-oxoglutarate reductase